MAGDEGSNRIVIRPATHSDIPKMLEMGEKFFNVSGYSEITEFDLESLKSTYETLIGSDSAVVLVGDGCMAVALIYPFYFNANHKTAQEMLWWAEKGGGTQLLEALIAGVQARGAQSLTMLCLDRLTPERVGAIYERRGFRPSERSYIKKL